MLNSHYLALSHVYSDLSPHLEKPFIVRVNEKMLIYSHYQYSKYLYVQLFHNVMQSLSF